MLVNKETKTNNIIFSDSEKYDELLNMYAILFKISNVTAYFR